MIEWIKSNWNLLVEGYGYIVAICTIIIKLAPNTKNAKVLGKIIKILDFFSTAFTKEDAEKLKKGN